MHGYDLPPDEHRLLRGPVPAEDLAWVESAVAGSVTRCSPLAGGTSSAVHAIDVRGGAELVLRRFVRDDWLAEEPDAVLREAAALRVMADVGGVLTPRLIAVRPGPPVPALLMTRLVGEVD